MKPSANDFATKGDQYIGWKYSEIDCQKLVELMLSEVGIHKNLPGSNAWYRYCRENGWVGTPEECRKKFGKIPVGAWLFILENNGKEPDKYKADGLGNASHIGVYIGRKDGAIHSSSSRGCVAYSKFNGRTISGGWNTIGLPTALLDYGPDFGGGTPDNREEKPMETKTALVVLPDGAKGSTVNMRRKNSRDSDILVRVPVGSMVTVTQDLGDWCAIMYDGKSGYMMSNYLEYEGQEGESNGNITLTPEDAEIISDSLSRLAEAIADAIDKIGNIVGRG